MRVSVCAPTACGSVLHTPLRATCRHFRPQQCRYLTGTAGTCHQSSPTGSGPRLWLRGDGARVELGLYYLVALPDLRVFDWFVFLQITIVVLKQSLCRQLICCGFSISLCKTGYRTPGGRRQYFPLLQQSAKSYLWGRQRGHMGSVSGPFLQHRCWWPP